MWDAVWSLLVASTMTLQHHSSSDLPPKKRNQIPTLHRPNSVRMDTHMPINSMSRCQNTLYTSSMDVGCSLKPPVASTMTLQHHSGSDLPKKNTKSAPHLHRLVSVRVNSYGHSHYFKLLVKHFEYIQYGCGVH
jgi:hypothetical protein